MKYQYSFVAGFFMLLVGSYYLGYTNLIVVALFLSISIISYLLYAKDKAAARSGDWRVSEQTLHFFALCGGWPGAIFAQQRLRHKTQKKSFRHVFWLTVAINLAAFGSLHSQAGQTFYRNATYRVQLQAMNSAIPETLLNSILFMTQFRKQPKQPITKWLTK